MPNTHPSPDGPIPQALADALSRELESTEIVRWSAQPGEEQSAANGLAQGGGLSLAAAFFAVLFGFGAYFTLDSYRTGEPSSPGNPPDSLMSVIVFFSAFTVALAVVVLAPIVMWRHALRTARSTVYALTNTRLLSLRLNSKGLPRITSLEPAHPLDLSRTDHQDGRGTLAVQRVGQSALLTLVAISEPRRVDQLIRETFDPAPAGTVVSQ